MKEKKICRKKHRNGKSIERGSEKKREKRKKRKKSSHGSDPTGKIYSGT